MLEDECLIGFGLIEERLDLGLNKIAQTAGIRSWAANGQTDNQFGPVASLVMSTHESTDIGTKGHGEDASSREDDRPDPKVGVGPS